EPDALSKGGCEPDAPSKGGWWMRTRAGCALALAWRVGLAVRSKGGHKPYQCLRVPLLGASGSRLLPSIRLRTLVNVSNMSDETLFPKGSKGPSMVRKH